MFVKKITFKYFCFASEGGVAVMSDDEFGLKNLTAQMIKSVRNETRAGTIDCRDALIESKGDINKAIEILKEKRIDAPKKVWT